MGGLQGGAAPEPTVLIVGSGEPLVEGIVEAAVRHGLAVERSTIGLCAQTTVAVAPDAVLLVGDAARDGGVEAVELLSGSPLASVVPVVLLADADRGLSGRLAAFRRGATAHVERSASVDGIARRLAELVRRIPEAQGTQVGCVGEASLDDFVQTVARELRQGIVSVRCVGAMGEDEEVRLVMGEGARIHDAMQQFVGRVQGLIERAEVVRYEWQDSSSGGMSLVSSLGVESAGRASVAGARLLLADDDVARADVIAQQLREAGAVVAVVDSQGWGLVRARALDPQALVVGDSLIRGAGFDLVRRLRADARMRWAHMIVVPWDDVWAEGTAPPRLDPLLGRIARAIRVESVIQRRVTTKRSFDFRLEAIGAARLLRQLGDEREHGLRLTVWNPRATVRVDLGAGLVIGAHALVPGAPAGVEGDAALAMLLAMASGRARVEHVESPLATNVMSPVEEALGRAEAEGIPGPPEAPPPSLRERVSGSVFPVAVARTERPPADPAAPGAPDVPRPASLPVPSRFPTLRGVAPPVAMPTLDRQARRPRAVGATTRWVREPPAQNDRRDERPDEPTVPSSVSEELALASSPDARTSEARRARRRTGRLSLALGLALATGVAGAAWWTGWPPEAWAAMAIAPRVQAHPVVRASRPPEPDAWSSPPTSVAAADGVADEAPGSTSGKPGVEGERTAPEDPGPPDDPTGRPPAGADPSFAVPGWVGDLGELRRRYRARQLLGLGQRNLRNGRPDRALTWYRRAWWFHQGATTARGVGRSYLVAGEIEQARVWAEHALRLDVDDPHARLLLGDILRAEGDREGARESYQRALELAPRNVTVRRRLRALDASADAQQERLDEGDEQHGDDADRDP